MNRFEIFYWLARWTFAIPLFLLMVLLFAYCQVFNRVFAVDNDSEPMGEWPGAIAEMWKWCFTERLDP